MVISEFQIHLPKEKMPEFHLATYKKPLFTTIKVVVMNGPSICLYLDSLQDVVNFKNSCLWACEKHIKEQTP